MTDLQLTERMRSGDEAALQEIIKKYGRLVTGIASGIFESDTDIEEIRSDTFFKLWRARHDIDTDRKSLKNYICMIARSCISDKLRYMNRIKRQEVIPKAENDLGIELNYEDKEARELNRNTVIACISTMPSPDKQVFIDRYYFNMPVKDIAKHEHLSEKKVENILYRGRKRLKEALLKGGILL